MGFKTFLVAALALLSAHAAGHLGPPPVGVLPNTAAVPGPQWEPGNLFLSKWKCSKQQKSRILEEMTAAYYAARAAQQAALKPGPYHKMLFSSDLLKDPEWRTRLSAQYGRLADVLASKAGDYRLKVTCNNQHDRCRDSRMIGWMNDATATMNLCDLWFSDSGMTNSYWTSTLLKKCDTLKLREATRAKANTLLHELTHTEFVMGGPKSLDVAYGVADAIRLARGGWDRSRAPYATGYQPAPLCPDKEGREGVCDAALSGRNADSLAMAAALVAWSERCRSDFKMPRIRDDDREA